MDIFPRAVGSAGAGGCRRAGGARRMRSECSSIGPPLRRPFSGDWTGCCPPWLPAGTRCWGWEVGPGHSLSPLLFTHPPLQPPPPPHPPAHPSAAFKARTGRLALSTLATENNELTEERRRDVEKSWGAEVLYKRFLCTWLRACSLKVKCKT